jgi:hypothetical protein
VKTHTLACAPPPAPPVSTSEKIMALTSKPGQERLLIFIPAYNEEGAIAAVVANVRAELPDADVLVIDDGSRDHTAAVARGAGAMVVRHPFNLGIGGAMQTGLKFAEAQGYDLAIRLDGDGQHQAAAIQRFLTILRAGEADMVIGSRFINETYDWTIPRSRRIGIWLYAAAVTAVTRARHTDTTSGFCGMNRPAIRALAAYLPQDFPDVESRVIIHKAGLRQKEVPVHMQARAAGVSSINLTKSIYYALKVTAAVLTTAMKDIECLPAYADEVQEVTDGNTIRAKGHRSALQPVAGLADPSIDPKAPPA